jgi:hypothetical protein
MDGIQEMLTKAQKYDELIKGGLEDNLRKASEYEELNVKYYELKVKYHELSVKYDTIEQVIAGREQGPAHDLELRSRVVIGTLVSDGVGTKYEEPVVSEAELCGEGEVGEEGARASGGGRQGGDPTRPAMVQYTVKQRAVVRQGFDMKSKPEEPLKIGQMIDALETKMNSKGILRVKFEGGWISEKSNDGTILLEKVAELGSDSDSGRKKAPERPTTRVDLTRDIPAEIMKSTYGDHPARPGRRGPHGHVVRTIDIANQLGWTLPPCVKSDVMYDPDYDHCSLQNFRGCEENMRWSPEVKRWVWKFSKESPMYKTGICHSYITEGGCRYSPDKCGHAHSESELRAYTVYRYPDVS